MWAPREGEEEDTKRLVRKGDHPNELASNKQARPIPFALSLGQSIRHLLAAQRSSRARIILLDGFDWIGGRGAVYEILLPFFFKFFLAVLEWMEPPIGNSGLT